MTAGLLSERDRALLEACLRDDDRAVQAFHRWRDHATPETMDGRDLRLMPLLHANMARHALSDARLAWIGGQAKHIWLSGALRRRTLGGVLALLETVGIQAALMKGAALGARFPAATRTRPAGDFDLLVRRADLRRAASALNAAGWRGMLGTALSEADIDRTHAFGLTDAEGTAVDLHWRPAAAIRTPDHAAGVWARCSWRHFGDRAARLVSLTDHLFILLAHAFHDEVEQRPDWVAEADLLFRHVPPAGWDWRLFHSLARRFRLEVWCREALLAVGEVTGRAPPPGAVRRARRFGRKRRAQEADEVASRGRSPLPPGSLASQRAARGFAKPAPAPGLAPGQAIALALRGESLATVPDLSGRVSPFPPGTVFLAGWSFPEEGWRWTELDSAVFCIPVPIGRPGDRFEVRMRLTPLHQLRERLAADAATGDMAGASGRYWAFADAPDGMFYALHGRLVSRGTPGSGGVVAVWLGLHGGFLPEEHRGSVEDTRRLGVRLDRMDLVVDPADPRIPTLNRTFLLADAESDVLAWSGWGHAEPEGRWTVGHEAVLLVRLPPGDAQGIAVRVVRGYGAGPTVPFEIQVEDRTPQRFAATVGHGGLTDGLPPDGLVVVALPARARHDWPVRVSIRVAQPAAPRDRGEGDDHRKLGLMVAHVSPVRIAGEKAVT